jgi:chemotaxis protein MotB
MSYADLMSAMLMVFALLLTYVMLDYKEVLEEKEEQIEALLSVKNEIIFELIEAFQSSDLQIEIDENTGAIRFPGSVLYEYNSAELSDTGEAFLQEFIPNYLGVLLQDRFRDDISSIIIEGHTDNQGDYLYNMSLSQERAFSVLTYIYSDGFPNFAEKEDSKTFITANGRSYIQPLTDQEGKYDAERSRRVEFLFQLKDDESIADLQKVLDE